MGTRRLLATLGLTAGSLALGSCESALGLSEGAAVYALAYVGGHPQDPDFDLLPICMPLHSADGAELYMLGDTLVLAANGTGSFSSHQRSRAADYQVTVDSNRVFHTYYRHEFRYRSEGLELKVYGDSIRLEFLKRRGGLEIDGWCGPWRYERIR